jgi:hypothetical protein
MTDQRPCSCGGSNENCAMCYGRGFIEGRAIWDGPIRTRPKRNKTVANLRSVVPPVPESVIPTRSRATTSMKNCPLCKSQVREDRLPKHMDNRCPLRPGKPERNKLVRQVAGDRHGIAEVFQRLYTSSKPERPSKRGMRGARASQQVKKSQHSAGIVSPESTRHKGKLEVERPSWWDNLDATKNCGYPAREAGRYGSYPSHDGFDDEAKP